MFSPVFKDIYNLQSRNCVVDVFFKVCARVCVCVQGDRNTDLNPATLTTDSSFSPEIFH